MKIWSLIPVPFATVFVLTSSGIFVVWLVFELLGIKRKLRRAHAELLQVKRLVEAERIAKDRFLAMMGHELRTPMNAILGFSELLRDENLGEDAKFYLNNIEKSGRHLTALFEQVLDYAKAEAGAMELTLQPFRLREALGELSKEIEQALARKAALPQPPRSLVFLCHVEPEVGDWWVGDVMRLQQILRQALINAVKFTDQGEIRLQVSSTREDGRVWLHFAICDTGLGMSDSYLTRAFVPFSQEDSGVTRKFGGLGIGLSLVKELTELKGGTLKLESAQGHGTVLTVSLPFSAPKPSLIGEAPQLIGVFSPF